MPESDSHLRIERRSGVAILVVDRAKKLNALNARVLAQLDAAFHELAEDDDVGAVVVTGAGDKAFVAGADIQELARMGPLDGVQISRDGQEAFRFVERMAKPVIAAVNGYALGGGLELALACHLRVASEHAQFGLPEVGLGIIPGYGGTLRLPRLVGRGRALEMILTGDRIDAAEAHRIGLVNRVVETGGAAAEAERLARRILENGPIAIKMALEAVDHGMTASVEGAHTFEAKLFGLLAATDDMKEGMSAFMEKRDAEFDGR